MPKQLIIISKHFAKQSGARMLSEALQAKRWRNKKPPELRIRNKYNNKNSVILNWGYNNPQNYIIPLTINLNPNYKVANAVNKLITLRMLKEHKIPTLEFYESLQALKAAKIKPETKIFCRTLLTGSKGDGIVLKQIEDNDIPNCNLYTINFPKTHEYRVHVFNGKVIDVAQKKTMGEEKRNNHNIKEINRLVRNLNNGWFYSKELTEYDETISELAVKAIKTLGLDFGAVDVLAKWSRPEEILGGKRIFKNAVVCEVNTAPGLQAESTLAAYVKAIKEYLNAV